MTKQPDRGFETLTEEAVTFAANQIREVARQAEQQRINERKASELMWRKLKELLDLQR